MKPKELKEAFKESSQVMLGAGFVLVFTMPLVRILINSGINGADLESMPVLMAKWVAISTGDIYPLFAQAIGAIAVLLGQEGETLRRTAIPNFILLYCSRSTCIYRYVYFRHC